MNNRSQLMWVQELIWWVVTAIVAWAVLYYIHKAMLEWPFEWWNVYFIVVGINAARYLLLLKHAPWARIQPLKIALVLLAFPTTFSLINGLSQFLNYIDEHTFEPLTGHLPADQMESMNTFLWREMILFALAGIIAVPALAIRLIISIWRTHNLNTV